MKWKPRKSPIKRAQRAKNPTAKKNSAAIVALQKNQYKHCQYYIEHLQEDSPSPSSFQIVNPDEWGRLFASNSNNEIGDRFFLYLIKCQFNLTVNSSLNTIVTVTPMHYAIFIVSLSREYAKSTYNRTNSMTQFTDKVDYHYTSLGATVGAAQWTLNPMIYKIHASRKGMIGDFVNEGTIPVPVSPDFASSARTNNINDANKNHTMNIKWQRQLKKGIGELSSTKVDWKDMTLSEIEAHDQLFVLTFNNATELGSISIHAGFTIYGKEPI